MIKCTITPSMLRLMVNVDVFKTSVRAVAKKIGVSPSYISLIINEKCHPSQKIAAHYGYKKVVLFERVKE